MTYRPIMNPIDGFDPRRQPEMQDQSSRQKVAQALISPQQFAFGAGRNFSDMYYAGPPQQPQMGRIMRPAKGIR